MLGPCLGLVLRLLQEDIQVLIDFLLLILYVYETLQGLVRAVFLIFYCLLALFNLAHELGYLLIILFLLLDYQLCLFSLVLEVLLPLLRLFIILPQALQILLLLCLLSGARICRIRLRICRIRPRICHSQVDLILSFDFNLGLLLNALF